MSFVANEPSSTSQESVIKNDGFFPDVTMLDAKEAMRLDGTVTDGRLRHALIAAIIEVNRDLIDYQAENTKQGYLTLAAVPRAIVDDKPVAVQCYLRAVYCYAKADIVERMSDFDATAERQRTAHWLESTPDQLRRDASWAITMILNRPRATVELI